MHDPQILGILKRIYIIILFQISEENMQNLQDCDRRVLNDGLGNRVGILTHRGTQTDGVNVVEFTSLLATIM